MKFMPALVIVGLLGLFTSIVSAQDSKPDGEEGVNSEWVDAVFKTHDSDKNGIITIKEIREVDRAIYGASEVAITKEDIEALHKKYSHRFRIELFLQADADDDLKMSRPDMVQAVRDNSKLMSRRDWTDFAHETYLRLEWLAGETKTQKLNCTKIAKGAVAFLKQSLKSHPDRGQGFASSERKNRNLQMFSELVGFDQDGDNIVQEVEILRTTLFYEANGLEAELNSKAAESLTQWQVLCNFLTHDRNADGFLQRKEVEDAWGKFTKKRWAAWDLDSDEKWSKKEFAIGLRAQMKGSVLPAESKIENYESNAHGEFLYNDTNKDQFVEIDELDKLTELYNKRLGALKTEKEKSDFRGMNRFLFDLKDLLTADRNDDQRMSLNEYSRWVRGKSVTLTNEDYRVLAERSFGEVKSRYNQGDMATIDLGKFAAYVLDWTKVEYSKVKNDKEKLGMLKKYNYRLNELEDLEFMDVDSNKSINFSEYHWFLIESGESSLSLHRKGNGLSELYIRTTIDVYFIVLDEDKNGKISKSEYDGVFNIERRVTELHDKDEDGELDRSELREVLKAPIDWGIVPPEPELEPEEEE